MILLNDRRVLQTERRECGESMVSLRGLHPRILIDETRSKISNRSPYFCYARESVAARLIQAVEMLPEEYAFYMKEAYRPLATQTQSFGRAQRDYRALFPAESEDKIYALACQFVAPPEVAGHPTGGAVDLTLLFNGEEVDMGTEYNDTPTPPENRTWLESDFISQEAKANRTLLTRVMKASGFINYPTEWWHWSYGDCYWACLTDTSTLYCGVDETVIENSME